MSKAVVCTIGRLEYIDKSIVGDECRELFGYHPYQCLTKDTIASQRYVTPREFAVNNVTLRNGAPFIF